MADAIYVGISHRATACPDGAVVDPEPASIQRLGSSGLT